MNKGGFFATLLLCSCAASPDRPVATGVDAPVPMSPVIRGEGIEVRHLRGEATIEEVHVALQAASGRRLTNDFMLAQGYEVHAIDLSIMDPFSRSTLPITTPNVGWLGMPVIWREVASADVGRLLVRTWPLLTELGPRVVVELAAQRSDNQGELVRSEYLLPPGDGLVIAPSRGRWPEEGPGRPATIGAAVLQWSQVDRDVDHGPLMVLLLPRFGY